LILIHGGNCTEKNKKENKIAVTAAEPAGLAERREEEYQYLRDMTKGKRGK
jgi:hypothetical protein